MRTVCTPCCCFSGSSRAFLIILLGGCLIRRVAVLPAILCAGSRRTGQSSTSNRAPSQADVVREVNHCERLLFSLCGAAFGERTPAEGYGTSRPDWSRCLVGTPLSFVLVVVFHGVLLLDIAPDALAAAVQNYTYLGHRRSVTPTPNHSASRGHLP